MLDHGWNPLEGNRMSLNSGTMINWTFWIFGLLLPVHDLEHPEQKRKIHLLFVGNSLTYTNNLPAMVAARMKPYQVIADVLAKPNYALEDHWQEGRLPLLMASNHYNFVIVQQGPSSQQDGREMLMTYGEKINVLCKQTGSRLAFFMVWPAYAQYTMFDGVIRNYSDAATATGSILCPVGKVWKQHFTATQDFSYYGSDLFHPSRKGSEVAADVIASELLKHL